MKKLLFIATLFSATLTFGQVEKGRLFLTGTGNFSSTSGETENNVSTQDNPTVTNGSVGLGAGYFIADGLAVGLGVFIGSSKTDDSENDIINKSNTYGFILGARKYTKVANHLYLFGQLAANFGGGTSETENNGVTTDGPDLSFFGVNLSPGITFFPGTHKMAFDLTVGNLGYNSQKSDNGTTENRSGTFGLGFDLTSVNFGVQVFIGGSPQQTAIPNP